MTSLNLNVSRAVKSQSLCRALTVIDRFYSRKSCFVRFKQERAIPLKMKRQRQLESAMEKARESKRSHVTDEGPTESDANEWRM